MWKKVSSKTVFEHERMTLVEDEVELPSGKVIKYLKHLDDGHKAATVICKKGDKFLLQKEYSYPPHEILLQFPGGTVYKDEEIAIGANRELQEEAGLNGEDLRVIGCYLMDNRRSSAKMYVLFATKFTEKSLPPDETEEIESLWLTEKEIENMIQNGEIKNVHVLGPWAIYKSINK